MSVSDPLSDYLTVVRNASRAHKVRVTTRSSRLIAGVSQILKEEGFIEDFKDVEENGKKYIRLHLKYVRGSKPAIQELVRASVPGLRQYMGWQEIPQVLSGLGVAIISTSKGIMTGKKARKEKVGGELLCRVW
jgi:small subunit ribosomal protein S8